MGKKSSAKKPVVKKGPGVLATTFDCIICSGEGKINVTFDKKSSRALLKCGDCSTSWSRDFKNGGREDPVDVYYDWVDEAEEIRLKEEMRAKKQAARNAKAGPSTSTATTSKTTSSKASPRPRRSITPDFAEDDEGSEDDVVATSGRGAGSQKRRHEGGVGDDDSEGDEEEHEDEDERRAAQKKRRLQSDSEDDD